MTQERLSVSIPVGLVIWAQERARETDVPLSHLVAEAIRQMKIRETRRAMLTGALDERGITDPAQVEELASQIEAGLRAKASLLGIRRCPAR